MRSHGRKWKAGYRDVCQQEGNLIFKGMGGQRIRR